MARFFYTEAHDPRASRNGRHVIDKNLGLIAAMGVSVPDGAPVFPLERPASTVPRQLRSILSLGAGDRFAVINPGAAWPNKRWPPDRFGSIATALLERHRLRSVVLWGPGERPLADAVAASSGGAANIAPPTSIGDLVAVLAEASLLISGDTGPLHIGAAVGAPIVGIFGPTDPGRNGPWTADDENVSRFEVCACHHRRKCHARTWCLDDLAVDEVMRAVDRRLEKPASAWMNSPARLRGSEFRWDSSWRPWHSRSPSPRAARWRWECRSPSSGRRFACGRRGIS